MPAHLIIHAAPTRARLPRPACAVCGVAIRRGNGHYCSTACYRRAGYKRSPPDPSSEEIALLCALIRAGWTEEERLARLRADWRPAAVVGREVSLREVLLRAGIRLPPGEDPLRVHPRYCVRAGRPSRPFPTARP